MGFLHKKGPLANLYTNTSILYYTGTMRFIVFAVIFLVVMALTNAYIYFRFLKRVAPGYSRLLILIPVILMLGEIFFILDVTTGFIPDSPLLYLIDSAFIGITFMLFVVATIYDLVVTVSSKVPFDRDRRKTIKIIFDLTMIAASMSYLFQGLRQGFRPPIINRVQVRLKDFPINNFKIVQLTDIHVGRTIKRNYVEELVERTNALNPDLVVLTGDIIDLPIAKIRHDLEPLRNLKAPTYFTLGNHEYFHDLEYSIEFLQSLGLRPLLNDSAVIRKSGHEFNLIGINDLTGQRMGIHPPDATQAYARADQRRHNIVLAHQPRMIDLVKDFRCDLMLCGHTHGGQIFPFGLLVMMGQPYLAGLHHHNAETQIFVSRGTGYWGPPLRVLAPSEISEITLMSA